MPRTPLSINSFVEEGEETDEDVPLLLEQGEQKVDQATTGILDRMQAVLQSIEKEDMQATVSIPREKEEMLEHKPPVLVLRRKGVHLGSPQ